MTVKIIQASRELVNKIAGDMKPAAGFLIKKRVLVAFTLLGALHLFIALANTGSEWMYGHHGWAGARRSLNAKNYLRYGYGESRLGPLDNLGAMKTKEGKPVPRRIYWHHPAGLSLLISVVFAIFGESPASARLFITLISMLSFVMLVLIFRKFLGDWQTFVALVFLSFIPLYAAYLNFVNFEPFVLFCAISLIFLYESHRERRTWWKVLLMGVAVLFGAFSTYPIFPFFFFFWIVLTVAELKEGWKRWKLPVLFPVFVLAGGFLFLFSVKFMNEWTWERMYTSIKGLYVHRHTLKTETPHMLVLEYWDYYFRFFNPVVIGLTLYWMIDLACRALLRKWTRGDAYVLILFLMAFMYWYLLPQAAKIHEFVALYFPPPLAFAAAIGLWHLTISISHHSFKARLIMRLLAVAVFIVTSIPFIWSIRVFPTYKILTPVHELDSQREYNYFIPYNILARFVRDATEPDETVAYYQGFDIRPELWYWLDRNHRVIVKRREMVGAEKRRSYAFLMINAENVGVDVLDYLLERHNFVFTDHYYAFDLGNHLRSISFLRKNLKERSALAAYFISLPHPDYSIEEDKWKMVDLTLKLRGKDEAQRVKKLLGPTKSGSLSEVVARYNVKRADGGEPDLGEIRSHLDVQGDATFADAIEYLGSAIEQKGGRSYVRLLFRPAKPVDFDFFVMITADPLHDDKKLREEIGRKTRVIRFVIPSLLWKQGYVYVAENELLLFPGIYSLTFELVPSVTYQVLNETGDDNVFSFKCSALPDDFRGSAESATSDILGLTSSSPQTTGAMEDRLKKIGAAKFLARKDLGSDMIFLGCMAVPYGGEKWAARMFFYNVSIDGRQLNLTLGAQGQGLNAPYKKTLDPWLMKGSKAPGRVFMVEETFTADPSKLSMTMLWASPVVPSPLPSKQGAKLLLGRGDYGVHLPFQWFYGYRSIE
jgi:hypothetical protein